LILAMDKKLIYAGMTGGFGSLAQVVPILEALDKEKYRVVCSIHHSAAHALRQLGYEVIPYPDVGSPAFTTPKGRTWCDLDHYWGRFGFADEAYLGRVISTRLELIETLQPDMLLTQFCPPTEIIARILNIPLVCITQSCWHPAGKRLNWWNKTTSDYPLVYPVVNKILASYQRPPIASMRELNSGDLTFIPGIEEFDPVEDPKAHHLGPMHWNSASEIAAEDFPIPKQPFVLIYTGHLYDSAGKSGQLILEQAVAAFEHTEHHVLIAVGYGQDLDTTKYTRKNISIHEWVPLNKLLPHAALFIHHGGHGSCMAGLLASTPALVVPTFQEREFNARQLKLLALGDFLLPSELNGFTLLQKAEAVLADESICHSLSHWVKKVQQRAYGGSKLAAQLINKLAFNIETP